jgi:HD superfamily phosphohydrolase
MHIAGRMADALGLDKEEREKIRVAGLCHDLGQYPLSHCIEMVYMMIGDPEKDPAKETFENVDDLRRDDRTLLQLVTTLRPSAGEAKDKAIGQQVLLRRADIRQIFERHGKDAWVEDIGRIVSGQHSDTLYGALLNSDYDADRLDYVRRDAEMAGVVYGGVDLDYLLGNIEIRKWPVTSSNRVVAVHKRKGLGALEHYLIARFYMYSQVVFHKTVRSLELVAKAAFLGLAREARVYSSYGEILESIDTNGYMNFDDSYFFAALRDYEKDPGGSAEIKRLIRRVLERRPLRTVSEVRLLASDETDPRYRNALTMLSHPDTLGGIATRAAVSMDEIVVDAVPAVELVPLSKDIPTHEYIRLAQQIERGAQASNEIRTIATAPRLFVPEDPDGSSLLVEDEASLIRYLAERKLYLVRVYLDRDDDASAEDRLHHEIELLIPEAARG